MQNLEHATAQFDPVPRSRGGSAPRLNGGLRAGEEPIRCSWRPMLAEGQNLQDCNIVVNYDLPWAIVRLVQLHAVDRIGQKHDTILAYSFWPADGIEQIISAAQAPQ